MVVLIAVMAAQGWNLGAQPRDREMVDLQGPGGIDRRLRPGIRQVDREVRGVDIFAVAAKGRACREEQAARRAVLRDAPEIAKLGDDLAGRIHDHNLVLLIGVDPDIVMGVDGDAVGRVDAGGENYWYARRAVSVYRHLDDRVVGGVGDEHRGALVVEFDAVGAEGRVETTARHEQRIGRQPLREIVAILVGLPNYALEGIRDIDVARRVKADRVGPGARAERSHQSRRIARGIPFEDPALAESGDYGHPVRG